MSAPTTRVWWLTARLIRFRLDLWLGNLAGMLVAMLAIPFMLLLALFHLASRLLGIRQPDRDRPAPDQKVDEPDSERLGDD